PNLGRDFWVGVVARLKGDETSARAAFMKARAQQEEELRVHPDNADLLAELGLIDAGLGRKEDALNEGRRALELAPNVKDEFTEPYVKMCFAIISTSVSGLFALLACSVSAQNPSPTPGIPTEAEAERVIVTGSHIPTAEEVGPNPVDTYRPEEIEKLGARNATDLLTKLPQEMGS